MQKLKRENNIYLLICLVGKIGKASDVEVIGKWSGHLCPTYFKCPTHGKVRIRHIRNGFTNPKVKVHGHFAVHTHSSLIQKLRGVKGFEDFNSGRT